VGGHFHRRYARTGQQTRNHRPDELSSVEHSFASERARRILSRRIRVEQTFDDRHLRAIHYALFSPLYEWAGELRTYPLSKSGIPFAEPREISTYLDLSRNHIRTVAWDSLGRPEFAAEIATVFAWINTAHPFREGNGRASKVLLSQLAGQAGYYLDYSEVTAAEWNSASMLSMPDLGSFDPVPDTLVPVFARIATPLSPEHKP